MTRNGLLSQMIREIASMSNSTMLLISHDPTLVETLRTICRPIANLDLTTADEIFEAFNETDWDHVALVVIHLDRLSVPGEA